MKGNRSGIRKTGGMRRREDVEEVAVGVPPPRPAGAAVPNDVAFGNSDLPAPPSLLVRRAPSASARGGNETRRCLPV
eukprot:4401205-Pyramimonas_sp.AAC.1